MTKKIALIYAHPAPNKSKVNKYLLQAVQYAEHVVVRDLYELYPNMFINAEAEQQLLIESDVIIFQFPIYWFSSPAILKEWMDRVLSGGFAYGASNQLVDKELMLCVTTGGTEDSYQEGGRHGAPLDVYLQPFKQTGLFCKMKLLPDFIIQGVGDMSAGEVAIAGQEYQKIIHELGKGRGQS